MISFIFDKIGGDAEEKTCDWNYGWNIILKHTSPVMRSLGVFSENYGNTVGNFKWCVNLGVLSIESWDSLISITKKISPWLLLIFW